MFHRLIRILFFAGFVAYGHLWAQPDPPPGGPGGGDPPVGGSPLDGGLAIILVLAGLYGLWIGRHLLFGRKGAGSSGAPDPPKSSGQGESKG
jgi:hypothetical protein